MITQNKKKGFLLGLIGLGALVLLQGLEARDCEQFNDERSMLIHRFYEKNPSNGLARNLLNMKVFNSDRFRAYKDTPKGKKIFLHALKSEYNNTIMLLNTFSGNIERAIIEKNQELIDREIKCYQKQ